jgi:hypothetical protein
MKERLFISEMARQAIVRSAFLFVTINTKPHRMIHNPLSDRHLTEIPMTGCAIHLRPDMRRMVETHVRLFDKSIDALPGHIFVPLRMIPERLDPRVGRIPDVLMTRHADIDAGNSGARALFDPEMTIRAAHADVDRVNFMRKVDWLLGLGFNAQEMAGGIAEGRMRRGESGRTPPLRRVRINGSR